MTKNLCTCVSAEVTHSFKHSRKPGHYIFGDVTKSTV